MEEIKCPYCKYDGSDLNIGRENPHTTKSGTMKIRCSKCKREFGVEWGTKEVWTRCFTISPDAEAFIKNIYESTKK